MRKRKGLVQVGNHHNKTFILYDTTILRICPEYIMLGTGGWKTRHTKNCMNDNLPEGFSVYQRDFEWYVSLPSGEVLPFDEDEMIIYANDFI